jgi:hypothetical protein
LSRSFLTFDSKTGTKFSTVSPLFAIEMSTLSVSSVQVYLTLAWIVKAHPRHQQDNAS